MPRWQRAGPEATFASMIFCSETQDASGRRFLEQPGIARGGRSPLCGRTRTCATGKGHARLTPPLFACRPPYGVMGKSLVEPAQAGISLFGTVGLGRWRTRPGGAAGFEAFLVHAALPLFHAQNQLVAEVGVIGALVL